MKTLLLKEIRLLLPFWVAALLLAVAPMWLMSLHPKALVVTLLGLAAGIVLLSVVPFGMEFSNGTFQLLLTQPVPRRQIWRSKLLTLAVAVGSVLGVFYLSCWCRIEPALSLGHWIGFSLFGVLMAMAIVGGGLCTTLLLRQTAAAVLFTPLVPGFLFLALTRATGGFARDSSLVPGVVALVVYAVLALLWAAWLFQHFDDAGSLATEMAAPAPLSAPFHWLAQRLPLNQATLASLARKELHLQKPTFMVAAVMVSVWLVAVGMRLLNLGLDWQVLSLSLFVLWLGVPVVAGVTCVAEERRLGLHEWHLTLPLTVRQCWRVKVLVALATSVLLGLVLPYLLAQTFQWLFGLYSQFADYWPGELLEAMVEWLFGGLLGGWHGEMRDGIPTQFSGYFDWYLFQFFGGYIYTFQHFSLCIFGLVNLVLVCAAIYASTVSSNSLQAIVATLLLCATGLLLTSGLAKGANLLLADVPWNGPFTWEQKIILILAALVAGALALLAMVFEMGLANYRQPRRSRGTVFEQVTWFFATACVVQFCAHLLVFML